MTFSDAPKEKDSDGEEEKEKKKAEKGSKDEKAPKKEEKSAGEQCICLCRCGGRLEAKKISSTARLL